MPTLKEVADISAGFGGLLAAVSAAISARLAGKAIKASEQIELRQRRYQQRQTLLPLWKYISEVNDVDPDPGKVISAQVISNVNTLELVAMMVESEAVEGEVIDRVFGDEYIKLYRQIQDCKQMPDLNKTGVELISAAPAVGLFYEALVKTRNERGRVHNLDPTAETKGLPSRLYAAIFPSRSGGGHASAT